MRKIINISSFSRSRLNQDPVAGSFYGWHSQYAREVHARLGYKVESWSIDAGILRGTSYDRNSVRYRIFPSRFFLAPGREFAPGLLQALRSELKKHEVIIHLHDFHNWQSYLIAFLFPKAKIVGHYHGATKRPIERTRDQRKWLFAPLFLLEQAAESLAVKRIKYFFLANTQDREYYEKHSLPFSFCPMAPDLHFFTMMDRVSARRQLNIPNNQKVVLNVGGFARPKNLELLLSSFTHLRQRVAVKLFIIGPTYQRSYRQVVEAMIDRLQLRPDVSIVDFVPKSRLNVYYNAADLLLISSNHDEGGPTVALEALALGLPVLSTPVGFMRDIEGRAKQGLRLVDPLPQIISEAAAKVLTVKHERTPVSVWTWSDVMNVAQPVYQALFHS